MGMMQRLHVLQCPNQSLPCGEQIVLRPGSLLGRSPYPYYWPTDSETITLACPNCGLLSVHSESSVHPVGVPQENQSLPTSILWRVEYKCDREGCESLIVVHTRTEAD